MMFGLLHFSSSHVVKCLLLLECCMMHAELVPQVQKKPRANRKLIDSITLVDIAKCFHLPIREASKTLKIGVSILKRKCRKYGIPRWPHRKIKSLESLINDLEVNFAMDVCHSCDVLTFLTPAQLIFCHSYSMCLMTIQARKRSRSCSRWKRRGRLLR